jgi:hypothetical protein
MLCGGMGLHSLKGAEITSTCAEARGHVDRGHRPAYSGSVQHASDLAGYRGRARRSGGGGVMERCSDVSSREGA